MRSFARKLILALALISSGSALAQTFEQSNAAYERGDYRTAFAEYKKLA